MALKKVSPGDPLRIPASTFNLFVDAAKDFQNRQQQIRRKNTRDVHDSNIVLIKNNSGADRDRFDVLGIDGVLFTPTDNIEQFKNQVILQGVTPTTASHQGKFVILLEPIHSGKIGRAWINGTCPAHINVSAETDSYADVKDSDPASLQSSSEGLARIVWKESGTGVKWGVVTVGTPSQAQSPNILFGKPTNAYTSGATITLDPCDIHGTDTGENNKTVYVNADQSSYAMTNSTSIGTGTILPFYKGDDDNYYLLGMPIEVVTNWQFDNTAKKIQKKTRNIWILTGGSESNWVDCTTTTECPEQS